MKSSKNVQERVVQLRLSDGSVYPTSMHYMVKQIIALWSIGKGIRGAKIIGVKK